jgi:hypothetical protein
MPTKDINVINYMRQVLMPRVSRPQMGIALYPDTEGSTKVEARVTSTSLLLKFGTSTTTLSYIGSTVPELAANINRTSVPVRAVALSRGISLRANDLIGPTSFTAVPAGFTTYDRLSGGGAILRIARYTVKYNSLTKIKLLPPYTEDPGLPWRPRITNGAFTQEFRGRRFHFSIPEYGNQEWSLAYGRPFKDVSGASVVVKGDGIIQLPRYPVHWTEDNMVFYTDGAPLSTSIIEDVDVYNGLVYLRPGIVPTTTMQVDYVYLELNYLYPYLNINGHFSQSPDLINKFVVMYMRPRESSVAAGISRTVFHEIGDSIDGAIDSIEVDNPDIPVAILGAYSIQQAIASDRATILDTRIKGGGLVSKEGLKSPSHAIEDVFTKPGDEEEKPGIEDTYKDSASFWDIGRYDGEPYPGAAAVVVDVPNHLRDTLPEKDIRQKASKFLAAGVYPVFEFSNRTGLYVDGISQNISQVDNLGLSGAFGSATGTYWTCEGIQIPSGTVLTGWPSSFDLSVPVRTEDGASVLEVPQGSGYYQSYLKSSPDAILEWEERTLVAPSGKQNPNPLFSSWEKKRVVDDREVSAGQLTKGHFRLSTDYETKQFKNLSLYSPYRTDATGEIGKDVAEELVRIQLLNDTLVTLPDRAIVRRVDNVVTTGLVAESNYVGTHEKYRGLFNLTNLPYPYTYFNVIATGVGSGVLASLGAAGAFNAYNVTGASYDTTLEYTYNMSNQLEMLGDYARLSLDQYGSGSTEYLTALSGFGNALVQMSGAGEFAVSLAKPWINPDYSFAGTVGAQLESVDLSPETGFISVDPSNQDHRMTEILPPLMGIWSASPNNSSGVYDNNSTLQNLDNILFNSLPGLVRDSYSQIVSLYIPNLITGQPKDGGGRDVAKHWYSPHDRYGEFAGALALDGLRVVEHIVSGEGRAGSAAPHSGANENAKTAYRNDIRSILDSAFTGFHETLARGGILDPHTPRLLEAYGLYTKLGLDDAAAGGGIFDDSNTHLKYSGLYATGMKVMLKSMVTAEGDIQERGIVGQDLGPFSGTPPAEILGALSAGALFDDRYLAPLQGVVKTLTGNYSFGGAYPQDANLNSKVGGREADIFREAARAYVRLNSKFSDPAFVTISRNI